MAEAAFEASVRAAEETHAKEAAIALDLQQARCRRILRDDFIANLFDDVFNNPSRRNALRPFFIASGVPKAAADIAAYHDAVAAAIGDTVARAESRVADVLGSLSDILVAHASAVLCPTLRQAAAWLVVQDRHTMTEANHERVAFVESEFATRMTMIANHEARELNAHVTGTLLHGNAAPMHVGVGGKTLPSSTMNTGGSTADDAVSARLEECVRRLKPETLQRMTGEEAKDALLLSLQREASAWSRVDVLQRALDEHQVGDAERRRAFEQKTRREADAAVAATKDEAAAVQAELNRARQHQQALQEALLAASEMVDALDARLVLTGQRFEALCRVAVAEGRLPPAFATAERNLAEIQQEWRAADARDGEAAVELQRAALAQHQDAIGHGHPSAAAAVGGVGGAAVVSNRGPRVAASVAAMGETDGPAVATLPTPYFRCLVRVRQALAAAGEEARTDVLAAAPIRIARQQLLSDGASVPPAAVSERQRAIVDAALDVASQRTIAAAARAEADKLRKALASANVRALRREEASRDEHRRREAALADQLARVGADAERQRRRAGDAHSRLQEAVIERVVIDDDDTGIVDDLVRKLRARDAQVLLLKEQQMATMAVKPGSTTPVGTSSDDHRARPASAAYDVVAGIASDAGPSSDPMAAAATAGPRPPLASRPSSARNDTGAGIRHGGGGARTATPVELDAEWLVDRTVSAWGERPLSARSAVTSAGAKSQRTTSAAGAAPRMHQLGMYRASDVRTDVLRPRSAHTPRSRQLKAALSAAPSPASARPARGVHV